MNNHVKFSMFLIASIGSIHSSWQDKILAETDSQPISIKSDSCTNDKHSMRTVLVSSDFSQKDLTDYFHAIQPKLMHNQLVFVARDNDKNTLSPMDKGYVKSMKDDLLNHSALIGKALSLPSFTTDKSSPKIQQSFMWQIYNENEKSHKKSRQ